MNIIHKLLDSYISPSKNELALINDFRCNRIISSVMVLVGAFGMILDGLIGALDKMPFIALLSGWLFICFFVYIIPSKKNRLIYTSAMISIYIISMQIFDIFFNGYYHHFVFTNLIVISMGIVVHIPTIIFFVIYTYISEIIIIFYTYNDIIYGFINIFTSILAIFVIVFCAIIYEKQGKSSFNELYKSVTELENLELSKQKLYNLMCMVYPTTIVNSIQLYSTETQIFQFFGTVAFINVLYEGNERMLLNIRWLNSIVESVLRETEGVELIKIMGNRIMLVCGMKNEDNHYFEILAASFKIREKILANYSNAVIYCGTATGCIVGGLNLKLSYLFDVWWKTVNAASRMCSRNEITGIVSYFFDDCSKYDKYINCQSKIYTDVKGIGDVECLVIMWDDDKSRLSVNRECNIHDRNSDNKTKFADDITDETLKLNGNIFQQMIFPTFDDEIEKIYVYKMNEQCKIKDSIIMIIFVIALNTIGALNICLSSIHNNEWTLLIICEICIIIASISIVSIIIIYYKLDYENQIIKITKYIIVLIGVIAIAIMSLTNNYTINILLSVCMIIFLLICCLHDSKPIIKCGFGLLYASIIAIIWFSFSDLTLINIRSGVGLFSSGSLIIIISILSEYHNRSRFIALDSSKKACIKSEKCFSIFKHIINTIMPKQISGLHNEIKSPNDLKLLNDLFYQYSIAICVDIVKFTYHCEKCHADEILNIMTRIFSRCQDILCSKETGLIISESIGDALVFIKPNASDREINNIIKLCNELIQSLQIHNPIFWGDNDKVEVRIGVGSGIACSGIIGEDKIKYVFIGDSIDNAELNSYGNDAWSIKLCKQCRDKFQLCY